MSSTDPDDVLRRDFRILLDESVPPVTADEVMAAHSPASVRRVGVSHRRSFGRHRWRALLSAAIALVVTLGVIVGIVATRRASHLPYVTAGVEPPPGQLSRSVVVVPGASGCGRAGCVPVRFLEVAAASGQTLDSPEMPGGPGRPGLAITGSWIVAVSVGNGSLGPAVAFRPGSTRTTSLGLASNAFAGEHPGTAWLLDQSGITGPNGSPTSCSVRLMSVTGSQLSRSIPFACGATLIGAVRGGLLIDAADGSIEVWDPSSGATRTLSGFAAPQPLNYLWEENSILVTPNWANFCSSDCELVVASSTTGVVKPEVIQPPPGTSLTTTAALSPDGRFVGLVAIPDSTVQAIENQAPSSPPCCYVGSAPVAGEVVIVRSASGQVAMSRPTTLLWPARVQWSADGSYVLVTRSLYHDIEAVPAWSSSAPDSDIHLPSQPTTRYPGEGFVVVAAP